jgi:hypothetical protein
VIWITDPLDIYYLNLTSLSEHQADLVSNVVEEEPDATSYAKMKAVLVSTNTLSPYQMVDRLMAMEPLGGRKSTELLTVMQKLRPPRDDQFFTWEFLQRLPHEVRVLLAHDDHTDVRKLAEKAYGLLARHQPQGLAAPEVAKEDAVAAASAQDSIGLLCANYRSLLESGAERSHPEQCGWDNNWRSGFQTFILGLALWIPRL